MQFSKIRWHLYGTKPARRGGWSRNEGGARWTGPGEGRAEVDEAVIEPGRGGWSRDEGGEEPRTDRGNGGRVPEFGWSQLGVTEITLESGAGVGKVRLVMMACKWCAPMLSRNRAHLQFVTNWSRTSGDTVTARCLGFP